MRYDLEERHDWANIYRASTAYTLKRQTGWVLQHESSFKYFSLKCFLLKKTLLACLEKAKQDIKQERTIRIIYLTSKQLQQAQQKQPTTDHNRFGMIYN